MADRTILQRLDDFIEFATTTRKFADVGFYEDTKAYIMELEAASKRECEWEPSHDVYTKCNNKANDYWIDDPPNFCPFCGGKVKVV